MIGRSVKVIKNIRWRLVFSNFNKFCQIYTFTIGLPYTRMMSSLRIVRYYNHMHVYSPLPTIKCMSSCVIFENFSDDIASVCMDKLLEDYTHTPVTAAPS